jgi:hypothetical protein
MRKLSFLTLAVLVTAGLLASGSLAENNNHLNGDYVEVRTASVFAGACHYNGELTTTGRDALMAWRVESGSWNGVDLSGVRALAVVSSEANLAEKAARRSELIVNSEATHAQAAAMVNALKEKYGETLGDIATVKTRPLSFFKEGKAYSVASSGFATIEVESMPDDLCCKMPQLVWYQPLATLSQRKVGYTLKASYDGDTIGQPSERSGENSAFYGSFSF